MYCIGLTGSIASGKSTAAKIFTNLGANVISADRIARDITNQDKSVISKISKKFGANSLDEKGQINRAHLRNIIFQDSNSRIWLENLLHPLIRKEIEKEIHACKNKFCVIEIPLLKSREPFPYLDHVLLITTDKKTKLRRIIERDNCNPEQALQILKAQPSHKEYADISDTIIANDGQIHELQNKICDFLKTLNLYL